MDALTKVCTACGKTRLFTEFWSSSGNSDGRAGKCRTCAAAYKVARRAGHVAQPTDEERESIRDFSWARQADAYCMHLMERRPH